MTAPLQVPVRRIIAGPNGAGKTTFALKYLLEVAPGTAFVNADRVAAGLSPFARAVDHARCLLNSGPFPDIVFVQDGDKRTIFSQTVYDQLVKEAYP